jgi:hypothetical protein
VEDEASARGRADRQLGDVRVRRRGDGEEHGPGTDSVRRNLLTSYSPPSWATSARCMSVSVRRIDGRDGDPVRGLRREHLVAAEVPGLHPRAAPPPDAIRRANDVCGVNVVTIGDRTESICSCPG